MAPTRRTLALSDASYTVCVTYGPSLSLTILRTPLTFLLSSLLLLLSHNNTIPIRVSYFFSLSLYKRKGENKSLSYVLQKPKLSWTTGDKPRTRFLTPIYSILRFVHMGFWFSQLSSF
jgi:hypothetical protein